MMTRQEKRRFMRSLNVNEKELDNLAEYFRIENEALYRETVVQFLALTIEALRLEFGFGQKRGSYELRFSGYKYDLCYS